MFPAIVLLLTALPPARLTAQETSLTIYSDGRVLVRRVLPVAVPRGASTVGVDLGVRDLDAGSIVSLDSTIQVKGALVSSAIGLDGSLRRAIGTDVFFRVGADTAPKYIRGRVLSVDPPAVRVDANVMYAWPGTPVFPDSMVQLTPRFELALDATRAASRLPLLYMSSGLSWSAAYAVLLPRSGSGQARVTGTAQMLNPGAVSIAGAQVQLIAGDIRSMGQRIQVSAMSVRGAGMVEASPLEPGEEAVGGIHVYTLPGSIDITPGETRTVALFPDAEAAVEPELVLRAPDFGLTAQWQGTQRDAHPFITYRVHRPATSPLGGIPLPLGTVRVYQPDSAGRRQLLGEVQIQHSPAGRDLRLTTGTDFDVTAQRSQTAYEPHGPRDNITAYRVELQNAKSQDVAVLVADLCPGRCEVLSSSVPAEQPSVNSIGFRVTVPAGGSATLEYRVRARW